MKTFAVATAFVSAFAAVHAFEMSFPNSDGGYWVADYNNTLNWKANSTDSEYFTVQLLNSNSSQLNGNFQIANAIMTANGTALIPIDQIPTGIYSILFVNSSNYQLDNPEVYYQSNTFEIKPNGTEPAQVTANRNADPSDTEEASATGSSSSASSPTNSAAPSSGSNSAASLNTRDAAVFGTLATFGLSLGLSLLA